MKKLQKHTGARRTVEAGLVYAYESSLGPTTSGYSRMPEDEKARIRSALDTDTKTVTSETEAGMDSNGGFFGVKVVTVNGVTFVQEATLNESHTYVLDSNGNSYDLLK